jgi:hypothetical protein
MRKQKEAKLADGVLELDSLTLGGQVIDLNYYFSQEYTEIGQASLELPNLIEWVNSQLQVMYEDKLNYEFQIKKAEARAYFDLKSGTYTNLYGSKPTEKGLEHAVALDEEVESISLKLNGTSAWVRRLGQLQTSLQTKLDLVRSSEATRRRLIEPAELELEREARRKSEEEKD